MKSRSFSILAAVCILLLPGACATTDTWHSGVIGDFDTDSDGRLSKEEFYQGYSIQVFRTMDMNGDGVVEWEEWQRVDNRPDARRHFESVDRNGDGRVTLFEYQHPSNEMPDIHSNFAVMDRDQDGFLTPAEMSRFRGIEAFTVHF